MCGVGTPAMTSEDNQFLPLLRIELKTALEATLSLWPKLVALILPQVVDITFPVVYDKMSEYELVTESCWLAQISLELAL